MAAAATAVTDGDTKRAEKDAKTIGVLRDKISALEAKLDKVTERVDAFETWYRSKRTVDAESGDSEQPYDHELAVELRQLVADLLILTPKK